MPDIPNVPGVPPLSGYSSSPIPLLVADAAVVLSALLPSAWGIYIDGQPVITPASLLTQTLAPVLNAIGALASLIGFPNVVPVTGSTIEFDYTADSPISNYPQEQGGFQSYNKVQLPADIRLKIACGGSSGQRQGFFGILEALRTSTVLCDIVTPDGIYPSYNCKHIDYRRRSDNGVDLVVADVWFEQVNESAGADFTNTQQPGDSAQQSIGNVQPQTVPSGVTQQFQGIGSSPF